MNSFVEVKANKRTLENRSLVYGKCVHLGRFDNLDNAVFAYRSAKYENIMKFAALETNTKIKNGLIRHAEVYSDETV